MEEYAYAAVPRPVRTPAVIVKRLHVADGSTHGRLPAVATTTASMRRAARSEPEAQYARAVLANNMLLVADGRLTCAHCKALLRSDAAAAAHLASSHRADALHCAWALGGDAQRDALLRAMGGEREEGEEGARGARAEIEALARAGGEVESDEDDWGELRGGGDEGDGARKGKTAREREAEELVALSSLNLPNRDGFAARRDAAEAHAPRTPRAAVDPRRSFGENAAALARARRSGDDASPRAGGGAGQLPRYLAKRREEEEEPHGGFVRRPAGYKFIVDPAALGRQMREKEKARVAEGRRLRREAQEAADARAADLASAQTGLGTGELALPMTPDATPILSSLGMMGDAQIDARGSSAGGTTAWGSSLVNDVTGHSCFTSRAASPVSSYSRMTSATPSRAPSRSGSVDNWDTLSRYSMRSKHSRSGPIIVETHDRKVKVIHEEMPEERALRERRSKHKVKSTNSATHYNNKRRLNLDRTGVNPERIAAAETELSDTMLLVDAVRPQHHGDEGRKTPFQARSEAGGNWGGSVVGSIGSSHATGGLTRYASTTDLSLGVSSQGEDEPSPSRGRKDAVPLDRTEKQLVRHSPLVVKPIASVPTVRDRRSLNQMNEAPLGVHVTATEAKKSVNPKLRNLPFIFSQQSTQRTPKDKVYVFLYGREMLPEVMPLPHAEETRSWGVLFGHALVFNKKGASPASGRFPNLRQDREGSTEGVVYQLSEWEMEVMDKHMRVPAHYVRTPVIVWKSNVRDRDMAHAAVEAFTYTAAADLVLPESMIDDYGPVNSLVSRDMVNGGSSFLSQSYMSHVKALVRHTDGFAANLAKHSPLLAQRNLRVYQANGGILGSRRGRSGGLFAAPAESKTNEQ